jgi:hypothetical protein
LLAEDLFRRGAKARFSGSLPLRVEKNISLPPPLRKISKADDLFGPAKSPFGGIIFIPSRIIEPVPKALKRILTLPLKRISPTRINPEGHP